MDLIITTRPGLIAHRELLFALLLGDVPHVGLERGTAHRLRQGLVCGVKEELGELLLPAREGRHVALLEHPLKHPHLGHVAA